MGRCTIHMRAIRPMDHRFLPNYPPTHLEHKFVASIVNAVSFDAPEEPALRIAPRNPLWGVSSLPSLETSFNHPQFQHYGLNQEKTGNMCMRLRSVMLSSAIIILSKSNVLSISRQRDNHLYVIVTN